MSKILNVISHSEFETAALAEKLAASFKSGDVIVLTGDLGAGKTVFVKGFAKGMGHNEDLVNSPSFTIINEYPGEKPLYHFDLYRMSEQDELYEIGWDEYLNREGVIVVEWGEKAKNYLPSKYYQINFKFLNDNEREIDISLESNEK